MTTSFLRDQLKSPKEKRCRNC